VLRIDLQDILKRLNNVKKDNNGYNAKCPAHEDKHNSLSVTQKGDKLLMKCQAGCSFVEILNCIKGMQSSGNKVEEIYRYVDENGEIIHETVKGSNKKFYQRHHNGKEYIYNLKGVKTIIYNLPDVIRAVKEGLDIYIPEGEKDCDNLKKLGFIATTNAMGSGKWRKEYNKYFKSAKNVIILPDNDIPGKEHADQVLKSLQDEAENIQIIYLPDLKDKEDVSDFIRKNGEVYARDYLNDITKNRGSNDESGDDVHNISRDNLHSLHSGNNNRSKKDEIKPWYKMVNGKKYFNAKILADHLIKDLNLCLLNHSICLSDGSTIVPEYKFKSQFIMSCLDEDMTIKQVDDVYMFILYILSNKE